MCLPWKPKIWQTPIDLYVFWLEFRCMADPGTGMGQTALSTEEYGAACMRAPNAWNLEASGQKQRWKPILGRYTGTGERAGTLNRLKFKKILNFPKDFYAPIIRHGGPAR